MPPDSVSDPTDWLSLPSIKSLAPLEAGLRCEICKDFYTAPVITQCCHTFCSGCIRRTSSSVNASRKCPLCWQNFDEGQLRKNKVVEELVRCFLLAREDILALGRRIDLEQSAESVPANGSRKRKRDTANIVTENSQEPSPRKTRSHGQQQTRRIEDSVEPEEEFEQVEQRQDTDYEPDDGKVPCPICQQRMPEAQVFTHLDSHSDDKPTATKPVIKVSNRIQPTIPAMTPLPTLSYQLFKDTALRKKLQELGIPVDGNKATMARRHTEWRNLVNANCDSSNPKSKAELLRELNQWERTLKASENTNAYAASTANVMDKDFKRQEWSNAHDSNFQNLIADAKARAKAKAVPKIEEPKVEEPSHESVPVDPAVTNGVPKSVTQNSAASQADFVILTSPENIQKVNGFDVP